MRLPIVCVEYDGTIPWGTQRLVQARTILGVNAFTTFEHPRPVQENLDFTWGTKHSDVEIIVRRHYFAIDLGDNVTDVYVTATASHSETLIQHDVKLAILLCETHVQSVHCGLG